jgi:hypothetical protein
MEGYHKKKLHKCGQNIAFTSHLSYRRTLHMTKRRFSILLSLMLLAGCSTSSRSTSFGIPLEERLENPLYAELFHAELVDRMVELSILEDSILTDPKKKAVVENTRRAELQHSKDVRKIQREGIGGFFQPMNELGKGEVLYINDMLYFGQDFVTAPGPNLHIFFTTVVDPRNVDFPDETAMDLGPIESPYGSQRYVVPPVENPLLYRTVVIWDSALERLWSFAQISPNE